MASPVSSLVNKLKGRGLQTIVVQRFKGIDLYHTYPNVGPDHCLDSLNVVMANSGGLEKFRIPTVLFQLPIASGPDRFFYFSQAAQGLRHILITNGDTVWYLPAGTYAGLAAIDINPLNVGTWDGVESNNIEFMCNGQRMMRWTGTNWWAWGLPVPTLAPQFGAPPQNINSLNRSANVTTVNISSIDGFFYNPEVGDTVTISGCSDASFNGKFSIATASLTVSGSFTIRNPGPNTIVNNSGQLVRYTTLMADRAGENYLVGVQVQRLNGVSTVNVANNGGFLAGELVNVTGFTVSDVASGSLDVTSFNGTWLLTAVTSGTISWNQLDADFPLTNCSSHVARVTGGITTSNGGRLYAYAWKNSVTQDESSLSPPSVLPPSVVAGVLTNRRVGVIADDVPDPQVDTIVWYATLDGGSDFFFHSEVPTVSPPAFNRLNDGKADALLNLQRRGSFINDPPLVGKYLQKFQGRIFVAGIAGFPQDIIYSGYERINVGRPENCFPPYNRIRLALGADELRGFGVIQQGIIAFDQSNRMFMLRGIMEDITISSPVMFSAFLEELPWQLGCASHYSIQSTPYGLVWLGANKNLQLYNGTGQPQELSGSVLPLLNQITVGQEFNCRSAYFNWLDQDWYCLLVPVNGSQLNRILFFDLNPNQDENTGCFISDIQADNIGVVEDANGTRHLVISQDGALKEINVSSQTVNGVANEIDATDGQLNGYWRSGYFGNDSPQSAKMFRYARIVADQRKGFGAIVRLVDDYTRTFRLPEVMDQGLAAGGGKVSINRKAKRASVEIQFPSADASCSVLELQMSYIPTGDR